MDKNIARTIADSLTWARIFSVLPISLLAWYNLKWWVFGLYIATALTDLLDGMFARRAAPPGTDFDLDGVADRILSFATLLWLWMLIPGFVQTYWLPYVPIFVSLETYVMYVRLRHKRYGVPHLTFGRFAMALFFFLLPVVIVWGDVPCFVHSVLIVAVVAELQLSWAFCNRRAA
ncbi:MAG: CDP-alcohol phosphatidyltransferase family protein [Gammaproteobacteria bacterium]|nr:CDP-alcohol phosphatidyltransferase family protein [Gammaproteobacteria bacterium]